MSVRVGCSCACAVAHMPHIAVFLCACERFFVMRGRAKRAWIRWRGVVELEYADETGQTLKRSLRSALVNLTNSEPGRCGECWRRSSGGDERKFTESARKIFQVQGSLFRCGRWIVYD